jgi:Big-like domain-containing protein/ASPM-SPD-2-Hydin domain-containing protein/carboxypeptidase family protein
VPVAKNYLKSGWLCLLLAVLPVLGGCGSTGVTSAATTTNPQPPNPPATWTISGTLSPASSTSGASVALQGPTTASTTADANGNYRFSGLSDGSYTIVPAKSGLTFNPASQTVTVNGASQSNVSFAATSAGGPALQSITISAAATNMAKGASDQFTAVGTFSDGSTQTLTASVTWRSSNAAVATVNANGLASGLSAGTANISASQNGITSNSLTVTVTSATLQSIAISAGATSIAKGTATQFTAIGNFSDGTTQNVSNTATWSSSNTTVASLSAGGLATGLTSGTASVSATQGAVKSNSITLTVTAARLQSISISAANASIAKGTTDQFSAVGTFSDGSTQSLTGSAVFNSSNTAVATVGANGLINGAGVGSANISASQNGVTSNAVTITVTAATLQSIAVTGSASVAVGSTAQFTATGTFSDASKQNITGTATWNSSNPAAVTVSSAGVATGVAVGQATLSATMAGISGSAQMSVTAAISGTLSPSASASGANVSLTGAASATTTADSSGRYTFAGLGNGSYTITPTKSGITFTPASQSIIISGSSITGINFSVALGQLSAPASIAFGSIAVGNSGSQSLTIQNTGNAGVSISKINVTGSAFALNGVNLPVTVGAGQSVTYSAQFTPAFGGNTTGSFSIVSNAVNTPLNIALNGTGVAQLTVSPSTLAFGSLQTGASTTLPGTLGAQGGNVTISAVSVSGSSYSITGIAFPLTIPTGQTVSFNVTFAPNAGGSLPGSMSFVSNSTSSPTSIALTGSGVAPSHRADLSWIASTSTVVGYNVYRGSKSGGPYVLITSAPVVLTSYTDSTVLGGGTYFYVVTAVDGNSIESSFSNEAQAVIPTP